MNDLKNTATEDLLDELERMYSNEHWLYIFECEAHFSKKALIRTEILSRVKVK